MVFGLFKKKEKLQDKIESMNEKSKSVLSHLRKIEQELIEKSELVLQTEIAVDEEYRYLLRGNILFKVGARIHNRRTQDKTSLPFECEYGYKYRKHEIDGYIQIRRMKEDTVLQSKIIAFLKKEKTKLPASDIDFQLKIGDVDLVKKLCEEMYRAKIIGRTGNYRYFV